MIRNHLEWSANEIVSELFTRPDYTQRFLFRSGPFLFISTECTRDEFHWMTPVVVFLRQNGSEALFACIGLHNEGFIVIGVAEDRVVDEFLLERVKCFATFISPVPLLFVCERR